MQVDGVPFMILDILYSQYNDVAFPYIFAYQYERDSLMYVRTIEEFYDVVDMLIKNKISIRIYTWNLNRLYSMFQDTEYVLNETGTCDIGHYAFRVGTLTFCSINTLMGKIKHKDIVGEEEYDTGVITPNTSLKARGVNWVMPYLKNSLNKEFDLIQSLYEQYGYDLAYTRAGLQKIELSKSCFGDLFRNLREDYKEYKMGTIVNNPFEKMSKYRATYLGTEKYPKAPIIDVKHFNFMYRCFRNGICTYNSKYANTLIKANIGHRDVCSQYPSELVKNKFPMKRLDIFSDENRARNIPFNRLLSEVYEKDRWAMLCIQFRGIHSKHCCRPLYKYGETDNECNLMVVGSLNHEYDGKQLVYAESCIVWITANELLYLLKFYDYKELRILYADVYTQDYLPVEFIHVIMDMFRKKAEHKGDEHIIELFYKVGLNACWGFMASGFKDKNKLVESIENYTKYTGQFSDRCWLFQWAVAVTSYARCTTLQAILICGDSWIYSDADSIFYIKSDELESRLDNYNNYLRDKIKESPYYELFGGCKIRSKFVNKLYELGIFDCEDDLNYMIVYGQKYYIAAGVDLDGKLICTESATSGITDLDLESWILDFDSVDEFFECLNYEHQSVPIEFGYNKVAIPHNGKILEVRDLVNNSYTISIPSNIYYAKRKSVLSNRHIRFIENVNFNK